MWSKLLFYSLIGVLLFVLAAKQASGEEETRKDLMTIFLCGDVMTGRGIDQALPHPSDPQLYEPYVRDARRYVELAENANGPIQQPVDFAYIWGDALEELERLAPDVRIINLETSITKSDEFWKGKGINYRMHPENIPCLTAAHIDVCALANNHVLDWEYAGLLETLDTLKRANIKAAGAGRNLREAQAPAIVEIEEKGRVLVFSFGSETSGVPSSWAASKDWPGVHLLHDLSGKTVRQIQAEIQKVKQPGDIIVASIHWGSNWGYDIPFDHRAFAYQLIDEAAVDIIHGHSSHHVKGLEVYHDRLIIYGCGDFLNDYEGILGYERFRDDLGLMYFVSMDPATGELVRVHMTPTQIKNFKIHRASQADSVWLGDVLNREGKKFGTQVKLNDDNTLILQWE